MAVMTVQKSKSALETQAATALKRLRAALAGLIAEVPTEIRRAADLERALKVSRTLAWQVFTIARSTDPLTEASKVPGQFAMDRFLKAADKAGVPRTRIQGVKTALEAFKDVVGTHARDRESFDSMLSAIAQPEETQIDLQYRRTAFQSNSHILGLQAEAQLNCHMFHPTRDDATRTDFVALRGLIGLTWIRREAACVISSLRVADDNNVMRRPFTTQPLMRGGNVPAEVGLLSDFCSTPLPKIKVSTTPTGLVNTELLGKTVGKQSAATYLIGHHIPSAGSIYKFEGESVHKSIAGVKTPSRVLVHDMLVAEDMFGALDPESLVYSDHRGVDNSLLDRGCDLLPLRSSVTYLGKGPSVMHTSDVPRYAEMVEYACRRLNWDAEKFDVYRCRVEYPVMPSSVVVQFDLPEKPK